MTMPFDTPVAVLGAGIRASRSRITYLADMVDGAYEVLATKASNYYKGSWIAHPAPRSIVLVPTPVQSPSERLRLRAVARRPGGLPLQPVLPD
jgi:hypothetical protein